MNAKKPKAEKPDEFIKRAERAFRRAAIKVRAEYKRAGLKPAVWPTK